MYFVKCSSFGDLYYAGTAGLYDMCCYNIYYIFLDWYLRLQSLTAGSHLISATNATNDAMQSLKQDDPVVLSVLQLKPNSKNCPLLYAVLCTNLLVYKLLNKHYKTIWKSFPQDLDVTIEKINAVCGKSGGYSDHYIRQAPDILRANQRALDILLIVTFKPDNFTKGPLMFVAVITVIVGDSAYTRNLRRGM